MIFDDTEQLLSMSCVGGTSSEILASPSPWIRALSIDWRSLVRVVGGHLNDEPSNTGLALKKRVRSAATPIACSTNWSALRSSRLRGTTPASNREISRRSSTRVRKRVTSLRNRSTAARARSGISDLRLSVPQWMLQRHERERSSWLTSEAKRASRSTRCSSASAISLNDSARTPRSGSFSGSTVSSRPPAIDFAARAASATVVPPDERQMPQQSR